MTANYYIVPGIVRTRAISFDEVINVVSIYTGLSRDQIIKRCRKRDTIFARHLVCYFARKCTIISLESIGEYFGGQDHTTVLHADEKIKGFLYIKDEVTCTAVEAIERMLKLNQEQSM